ncbi:ORF090 putative IMV phosphorylated membrane protein [Orf virus]|uniref:ORF090 putative IMV phosphorylated membrane protein n=1 Tax=Orf virus (strain Goat/Texas/SA00/2000) TaxID=647330 RepID=Q6TVN0_ORFSA|nr:ORF090 putative IMV phosphorylated membrane protein [Orf virus]AAR98315.1 ORF090 putative IMV phosphorylated membrane protein [Orf virus]
MDIFETLSSYYSGVLICGVLLLTAACVFAFVDFSKNTSNITDYVWRALCVTCFIVGAVLLLGLFVFSMYRKCSGSVPYARLNNTDIELTAR